MECFSSNFYSGETRRKLKNIFDIGEIHVWGNSRFANIKNRTGFANINAIN